MQVQVTQVRVLGGVCRQPLQLTSMANMRAAHSQRRIQRHLAEV